MCLVNDFSYGAAGVTITPWSPNDTCSSLTTVKVYEDCNTTNASAVWHDWDAAPASTAASPTGSKSGTSGTIEELNATAKVL